MEFLLIKLLFQNLSERVVNEQNALMNFSEKVSLLMIDTYNAVDPLISKYISEYTKVSKYTYLH